jgi:hypothetical protein
MARRPAAGGQRLDDPSTAAAVATDPDAAPRRVPEPVLIDEWQEVHKFLVLSSARSMTTHVRLGSRSPAALKRNLPPPPDREPGGSFG